MRDSPLGLIILKAGLTFFPVAMLNKRMAEKHLSQMSHSQIHLPRHRVPSSANRLYCPPKTESLLCYVFLFFFFAKNNFCLQQKLFFPRRGVVFCAKNSVLKILLIVKHIRSPNYIQNWHLSRVSPLRKVTSKRELLGPWHERQTPSRSLTAGEKRGLHVWAVERDGHEQIPNSKRKVVFAHIEFGRLINVALSPPTTKAIVVLIYCFFSRFT